MGDPLKRGLAAMAAVWSVVGCGAGHAAHPDRHLISTNGAGPIPATSGPSPQRAGLDAKVVWRPAAEAPRPPGSSDCAARHDQLQLSEARADYNWLYLDVQHRPTVASTDHAAMPATISLRVDGCPVRAPRASGTVVRDWASPSTLTVPLSGLPDGELDISVAALDLQATVALRKVGKSISPLPNDQRKGFKLTRGADASSESMITLGDSMKCASEVVP